jgi:hypothetical protein
VTRRGRPTRSRRSTRCFKPARWDLAELYDWKHYIESNFGTARGTGINGWGIMNQRNGVLLMIESATTLPVLTEWLRGLGVPCRLVLVEVRGPINALSVQAGR